MKENLPEVIVNAMRLLERSFELEPSGEQVRTFKNAIYLLNDSMEDFPSYRQQVEPIKFSHTSDLLSGLASHKPSLEYTLWLDYLLLFCIDLKQEIKTLRRENPSLFEYFLSFVDLYSKTIVPELETIISGFLGELRE